MEVYEPYKGYGITYKPFGGITQVEIMGIVLRTWTGNGERMGKKKAKKFIDDRVNF